MTPINHTITNMVIKCFFAAFTVIVSLLIINFAWRAIEWTAFDGSQIDFQLVWLFILYGSGMAGGVVMMWIFWQPDITTLTKKLTTPSLAYHTLHTVITVIKFKEW